MKIASAVHDIGHKALSLDMGREWMMLAERAEKRQASAAASPVHSAGPAASTGTEHTSVPACNPKMLN
jgi:hypothetical protein